MTKKMQLTLLYVLAAVLVAALALGVLSALAEDAANEPAVTVKLSAATDFVIDETGKLTGLSPDGEANIADGQYFELVIPANVTQVYTADFRDNDKLVKVSFAEGSQCSSLKYSNRSPSVFSNCTALKEVDFTNAVNLTDIEKEMFNGCTSLSSVIFAGSLNDNAEMSIGGSAFSQTALASFEIPVYVTSINSSAFSNCTALTTITVAEGNAKYTYYTDGSGSRYDQAVYEKDADGNITALAIVPSGMKKITLPYAVIESIEGAFDGIADLKYAEGLQTVDIEENADVYAFGNCLFLKEGGKFVDGEALFPTYADDLFFAPNSVEEITLPKSFDLECVDGVGGDLQDSIFWEKYLNTFSRPATGNFLKLKTINVEDGNTVYMSFAGSLLKKDYSDVWVPYAATSFTVPAGMTTMDFSALSANKFLQEIKIQDGNTAFVSDNGLIYNKEKTELFYVPSGMTEFYAPATLEKISENVFAVYEGDKRVANRIKNVYVEDIEAWSKIKFGEPIETAEQYAQKPDGSLSMDRRLNVAKELENGYGANPMSGGADMYVQNNGRWELLESLFLDFDGQISDFAFAGCKSLRTVTIGSKVTRIGEMSFAMCKNIRSISLPYVGCTQEYVGIDGKFGPSSAYAWEVFGGRGMVYSGTSMYSLAPEKIDTITVTGYNILTKTVDNDGSTVADGVTYPVYTVPRTAFQNAPVRKIVISIDNADEHDITFGWGLFFNSTVSVVDLENSKVTASQGSIITSGSSIKEITVPATLRELSTLIFSASEEDNALEKIIIPDGVEYIAQNDFGNLDTLTLPSTIGGFSHIDGVKTVYLTGFTQREGQEISDLLFSSGIYVALDSEIYANLPDIAKNNVEGENHAANKIFYQADVVFQIKDSNGNVLAEKTEKHLAAQGQYSSPYLKWTQTQGARGDVYWALDENYALPDVIGNYKVDGAKWTLDGASVTKDTCLKGDKAQYVISQTLSADSEILLTPENVVKQYDGKAWQVPEGMEITSVYATKGGNGYYTNHEMPFDAGTYSVTAKCKEGYAWYDDEIATSAQRTFTLQITPTSADAKWFYSPDGAAWQNVTGTVPERTYDGSAVHSRFYAEFTDVLGQTRRVDYTDLSLYVSGDRSSPVYSMIDVGTYEITVNDSGKTTDNVVWLGNYIIEGYLQFVVNPRVIDLNDYANLSWGLENYGSTLRNGNVYIYSGVPYAYEQPALGAPNSTLYVLDSIVRLRNADNHKIIISNVPALLAGDGVQYSAEYGGNTATATGIYTATARLTVANGNYVFGYGLGSDLKSRGMTITINPDGTAVVTKVWYVVAIDNGMLKADGTEYAINGWTFGDDVSIAAPRLEHGDEDDGYLNNNNVHFTLKRNDETIANNFARNVFGSYVNKSMPAGRYELVCVVSNVTVGNHTHWWNNEEHGGEDADVLYHGFTRTLVFEVKEADMTFTLPVNGDNGYAAYDWELNASKEGFFAKFESDVSAAGKVVLTSVVPQGYWADHRSEYYGNYSLTYNFARMSNNTYLKADDGNIHKYIEGGAKGTYTVYFQITAPNHNPLTGMGDGRYAYFFTVTVFEKVATPTVLDNGLVYTGSKLLPEVAESDLYEIIWDADDAYVEGGKHSVSFRLRDNVHYRWGDISLDTVSVDFTISRANNAWVRVPNIVNWTYDTFDTQINRIRAVVKFLDEGQSIKFSIVKSDNSAIAGLTDFEVKADGTIDDQTLIAALNGLKVGAYKLKVTVAGTNNYGAMDQYVDFTIGKSINTWADGEDDLVLPSWIVGKFNPEENPIVVKAAHGEAVIEIRDMDGKVYYNSTNPEENTLNTLDVGKYLLVAWVEESEDYAALAERSFTIEVLDKIGLPWWGTTLIAVGSLAVAAAIILVLWKLKVFEILTDKISLAITTRATVDATIAAVRAAKKAEEADAHKRKVEARERLEAAKEAHKNKTPEQRAEELAAKAEVTATKADKLHARANKMRERADKLAGKTEQTTDATGEATDQTDASED